MQLVNSYYMVSFPKMIVSCTNSAGATYEFDIILLFQNQLYLPSCLWSNQRIVIEWSFSKKVANKIFQFPSFVIMREHWGCPKICQHPSPTNRVVPHPPPASSFWWYHMLTKKLRWWQKKYLYIFQTCELSLANLLEGFGLSPAFSCTVHLELG